MIRLRHLHLRTKTKVRPIMITDVNLSRLMTWLSPSFPVGAFAYSHAIEHAVDINTIHDVDTLTQWVTGILTFGTERVDAALFRAAFEAMDNNTPERLFQIVQRGHAQRGTSELALESMTQGRAFLDTILNVWPHDRLIAWQKDLAQNDHTPPYAICVGVVCAVAGIPLQAALVAYLNAFCANLVSAAVRLVPLGQTDGQRTLAALEPHIIDAATAAMTRHKDDFSSAAVMVDWHSMQHETQYTRLFRS